MPYLVYTNKDSEKVHHLESGIYSIGRSLDNKIVVMDESLSRHHAEIAIAANNISIKDLQSLNHTFVNDVKIEQSELKDGDTIRCGNVQFQFVINLPASNSQDSQLVIPETIVKQFVPESTRLVMDELLDRQQTGSSVLRLRQKDQNQRVVDKLKILLEVCKQLSSPEEPTLLLGKILDLLFEIMNVERAAILLFDQTQSKLECQAVKLRPGLTIDNHFYSKEITNFVCKHGKAILSADALNDQRFGSESLLVQGIHATMCVPLKPRDEVIGVLYADNLSRADVYEDEDVEFLSALANQAAIAIDNAKLYQQIQQEAIIRDKLERFFPKAVTQKITETEKLGIVDTEVTALFADISGFTQMSSTMEPRQIITMLNEYFQVIVEEIVFRYEGTLEKYIGDALFAVWGAPYRKPDDPERAIQAAIDMQFAVQRLNQKWMQEGKRPIAIHIGINSGKVAAGNIGSDKLIQYATIGDTTNVTSRICNVAEAGEIVIANSTFERIQHLNLPLEKLDPSKTKVKGKDEPLILYRLLWNLCQYQNFKSTLPSM